MFYSEEITVPVNTLEGAAVSTEIHVTNGVLTRWCYRPRTGHAALCHAKVFYHEHQIIPHNPEAELHGDSFPIDSEERVELSSAPYLLKIKAWNDDDTYPHTFDISFTIMSKKTELVNGIRQAISDGVASIFGTPVKGAIS